MTFDDFILIAVVIIFTLLIYFKIRNFQYFRRETYINKYVFPAILSEKVRGKYPHLTKQQTDLVMVALRDYFYICHKAKGKAVAMPSQVVDVAWHEFILFTREYEMFCNKAFDRFLHHTPTEVMKSSVQATEGIKRAWLLCCTKEAIDLKNPTRLPLLFDIDTRLSIEDGFLYTLNCKDDKHHGSYCAGDISCSTSTRGCGSFDSDGAGGGCGGD
ncbi:glycine-rich domain-containing protein [Photobacterium leiognathi]|uniref:glycine-rich domain-containing protein n=1 Tax=Photobacterium leiognathi TaxID=553611 RepID=UPI0027357B08|nr:hypothetical protein [Photobacterium leiognathi]